MSPRQSALPTGTVIDGFTVLGVLGIGAFGITYKARDESLGRTVALKEYYPNDIAFRGPDHRTLAPSSEAFSDDYHFGVQRFLDEARVLARFQSPYVVRVVRFLEANGTAYFVMEYESGPALSQLIRQERRLTEETLRPLAVALLHGLGEIHSRGYLHRDVKPANIIVRENGSPVLVDFGAARASEAVESGGMTIIFTPGYAPFEQYASDGHLGPWTDLYALGATLFAALTGKSPVAATDRMLARDEGRPDPAQIALDYLAEELTPEFHRVLNWLLRPVASDRPQSASAALELLKSADAQRSTYESVYAPPAATGGATQTAAATPSTNGKSTDRTTTSRSTTEREKDVHQSMQVATPKSRRMTAAAWIIAGVVGLGIAGATYSHFQAAPEAPAPVVQTTAGTPAPAVTRDTEHEQSRETQSIAPSAAPTAGPSDGPSAEPAKPATTPQGVVASAAVGQPAKESPTSEPKVPQRPTADAPLRDALASGGYGPQFVKLPEGRFTFGSPISEPGRDEDEGPVQKVSIPVGYGLSAREITYAEFAAFVERTGYVTTAERIAGEGCMVDDGDWVWRPGSSWRDPGFPQTDNSPVVCVSWDDASAYVRWLSSETGTRYSLPSEAVWEYAARAGDDSSTPWNLGDDACEFSNVSDLSRARMHALDVNDDNVFMCSDGFAYTAPVGQFGANRFGLHDMLGNVWEWTSDCWTPAYDENRDGKAVVVAECDALSFRGGSWVNPPRYVRMASRAAAERTARYFNVGFRVMREGA